MQFSDVECADDGTHSARNATGLTVTYPESTILHEKGVALCVDVYTGLCGSLRQTVQLLRADSGGAHRHTWMVLLRRCSSGDILSGFSIFLSLQNGYHACRNGAHVYP